MGIQAASIIGLFCGILGALFGWLIYEISQESIVLKEHFYWSKPTSHQLKEAFYFTLQFGTIGGVIGAILSISLTQQDIYQLFSIIIGYFLFVVIGGIYFALFDLRTEREPEKRMSPNQGIHMSLKNGVSNFIAFMVLIVFTSTAFFGVWGFVNLRQNFNLDAGLFLGLLAGFLGGIYWGFMQYGGRAFIQHYVLRFLMARQKILPYPFRDKRLVAYLDAMAERVLLRRVGGGWIFIHRYLLEYFADQHPSNR